MCSVRVISVQLTLIPHSLNNPHKPISKPFDYRKECVRQHGTVNDVASTINPINIKLSIVAIDYFVDDRNIRLCLV